MSGAQSTGSKAVQVSPTTHRQAEIELDIRPFTDPMAQFASLRDDGQAKTISYLSSRLIVSAASQGSLTAAQTADLFGETRKTEFRTALRRRNFGGGGMTRGDLFHLRLSGTEVSGEMSGFLEDAPDVVRKLVQKLLGLHTQLPKAVLADCYLRGRMIEPDRLELLRREGRIRFLVVADLVPELQIILTQAVRGERNFHSLKRADYDQLLKLAASGHELFLLEKQLGYQVTLYESKP